MWTSFAVVSKGVSFINPLKNLRRPKSRPNPSAAYEIYTSSRTTSSSANHPKYPASPLDPAHPVERNVTSSQHKHLIDKVESRSCFPSIFPLFLGRTQVADAQGPRTRSQTRNPKPSSPPIAGSTIEASYGHIRQVIRQPGADE